MLFETFVIILLSVFAILSLILVYKYEKLTDEMLEQLNNFIRLAKKQENLIKQYDKLTDNFLDTIKKQRKTINELKKGEKNEKK